jgi:hypothetical protein
MRLDIETTISVLLTQRYVDVVRLLQSVYFVNQPTVIWSSLTRRQSTEHGRINSMNTHTIVVGLVALGMGAAGGYALNSNEAPTHAMPDGSAMVGMNHSGMQGEMDAMMVALEGKTGDEFDRTFLSEMIMHHQGAVLMAEAALTSAKHEEIEAMANAIISAQTTEIKQMQDWQEVWYGQ